MRIRLYLDEDVPYAFALALLNRGIEPTKNLHLRGVSKRILIMIILDLKVYHDNLSSCIIVDGKLITAAEKERLRRIKL